MADSEYVEEYRAQQRLKLSAALAKDELRGATAVLRKCMISEILPSGAPTSERQYALERLYGLMCALIDVADVLAAPSASADADEAVRLVVRVQERMWRRKVGTVAAFLLIDRIEEAANRIQSPLGQRDDRQTTNLARRAIGGMRFVGFDAIAMKEQDEQVVGAVATAITEWAAGAARWKPAAQALKAALGDDWNSETLQQMWTKWKHDPVRVPVIW